jgi:hypothetical protein
MPEMEIVPLCDAKLEGWKIGCTVEGYEVDRVLVAGRWDVWGAPSAEGVIC